MRNIFLQSIRLFVTGLVMGVADLIPGVSGGTIAFLSGIYEELLYSIRTVSGKTLKLLFQGNIRVAIASVPFGFLVPLVTGLGTSIFGLANLLAWLLRTYPIFVWAFFFGLVVASTVIVLQRVGHWNHLNKVLFLISLIVTYLLVGAVPIETPTSYLFIFISGAIAICAMILPGISGSFILLLMGKYQYILEALIDRDFFTLGIFIAGCIVGLSLFARLLSWLFSHYHDVSVVILAGIMLGSIRKIWPWREVVETRIDSHGEVVPIIEHNIVPVLDFSVVLAIGIAVIGAGIVWYLDRLKVVRERTQDIPTTDFASQHANEASTKPTA